MKRTVLNYFKDVSKLGLTACSLAFIYIVFAAPAVQAQEINDERMTQKTNNWLDKLERQKKAIVGSWLLNVKTPGYPDMTNLITFNEDGTLVATAQGDVTPLRVLSVALGAWSNQGGLRFSSTFLQVSYETPTGNLRGILKFRMTHTLDSTWKEWSGPYHFDFFGPDGTLLFSYGGTVTAQRIQVEQLP